MTSPCAWSGTITAFLKEDPAILLEALKAHHLRCMTSEADPSQLTAWEDCLTHLKSQFERLAASAPHASSWCLIFEYELPRERGRRPDVILITNAAILVLEFKAFSHPLRSHIDQVSAYARDLRHYHAATHEKPCAPILVLTKAKDHQSQSDDVTIICAAQIADLVTAQGGSAPNPIVNPTTWIQADYAPLPSLVNAARTIFRHEPLPSIRRAQSAGIPEALATLNQIARNAQGSSERHVALVTGVPGAGKTLVGLQFVYENEFDGVSSAKRTGVFLTGNGPLTKVLQHALKSSVFVQDVHGFLKQYGGNQNRIPEEHIWIYDEAQRAWDADRVQEKRGHATSEPHDFLRIGEKLDSWSLMIGLIGEGQEIHIGEESGLKQWNDAIQAMSKPWTVHCPQKVAHLFTSAAKVNTSDRLDLNTSLRSHLAEDVQLWVKRLLEGKIQEAYKISQHMIAQGFHAYVTRDLNQATNYVRDRYEGQQDKRYGLMASSKAKNLPAFAIHNEYNYTKNLREGPWFNDPPNSPNSCCQLLEVVTEFACQGLELDFPIVAWGNDLTWNGTRWRSVPQPRSQAKDPHQLRINSYRVLLSRGRDGFVIYVPATQEMDSTFQCLNQAGLRQLT